ncbi:AAA family ATPase, partial [Microbacterium sp.]|uniref:AAA family ATPase n=1 Tax=Microbacterium sp. TaxID=51671 RepID=UPI0035ADCCDB
MADVGHESALSGYSNQAKAQLRAAWATQFGLSAEESRSTATAALAATPRLKEATQRLYLGARDSTKPSRTLRESFHKFGKFLDESEDELFREAVDSAEEAQRLIDAETLNHRDLQDSVSSLIAIRESIAASGSSLLQDFVSPLIELAIMQSARASERLGDLSRPQVVVQLSSAKVPFSAAAGSPYQLRFIAQNTGNASAEDVQLRVTQSDIGLSSLGVLDSLGPGAAAEIVIDAVAEGAEVGAVTLECEITWSDALMQQFSSSQQVSAEDQGPVSWTDDDVNPFNLGTISDPQRLVGRDEDLFSLDALIAGGASAYVTGHKRVGKTSLTRVLLKSLQSKRGWAGGVLALGRAIVDGQSAGDIVSALLDEILSATEDAYPIAVKHIAAVEFDDSGNFARAANRWLKNLAKTLPDDARVIIAIDDFDELPGHLVEGAQADALFLFLRSLVDEPWLNLIVVGSEVLPAIIQKQAHKLNQVVPVSVTNFASRESTAALVVAPSEDRLEWVAEAIDRVHYLCGGNPYYETLVAQRLWQAMREQSRSIVTSGDVDDAVGAVAREAPESHFVHLWADSSNGLDHTARSAVVASAVLRSVARCGGTVLAPAATDEVIRIASTWIQTATTDELNRAIGSLKIREVIGNGPSDGSLLISIPLVAIWLLDAGSKVLDGIYSTS